MGKDNLLQSIYKSPNNFNMFIGGGALIPGSEEQTSSLYDGPNKLISQQLSIYGQNILQKPFNYNDNGNTSPQPLKVMDSEKQKESNNIPQWVRIPGLSLNTYS